MSKVRESLWELTRVEGTTQARFGPWRAFELLIHHGSGWWFSITFPPRRPILVLGFGSATEADGCV